MLPSLQQCSNHFSSGPITSAVLPSLQQCCHHYISVVITAAVLSSLQQCCHHDRSYHCCKLGRVWAVAFMNDSPAGSIVTSATKKISCGDMKSKLQCRVAPNLHGKCTPCSQLPPSSVRPRLPHPPPHQHITPAQMQRFRCSLPPSCPPSLR